MLLLVVNLVIIVGGLVGDIKLEYFVVMGLYVCFCVVVFVLFMVDGVWSML